MMYPDDITYYNTEQSISAMATSNYNGLQRGGYNMQWKGPLRRGQPPIGKSIAHAQLVVGA